MLYRALIFTFKTIEWLVFVVFLTLFFVIISPVLPTKTIIATYAVVSGSMSPTIPVGALAFVKQVPPATLKVGDVITFPDPHDSKRTVLHRITAVMQSGNIIEFKTKGDNNPAADLWTIPGHQVKGRLVSAIPYGGYPIQFAQTPRGFGLLIGIPAAILTIINMRQIVLGIHELLEKRASARTQTQPALAITNK